MTEDRSRCSVAPKDHARARAHAHDGVGSRRAPTRALLCVCVLVAGSLEPLAAQIPEVTMREDSALRAHTPQTRRLLGALGGAVILGLPAYVALDLPNRDMICSSRACLTAVAAGAGAIVGFLLGRELDQAAARRAGSSPDWVAQRIELPEAPVRMSTFASGALVTARTGFAYVRGAGPAQMRAATLRDILSVGVLPDRGTVLAATPEGLFALPLDGGALGRQVADRGAGVITTSETGAVYLAGLDLRRLSVEGTGTEVEVTEVAQAPTDATIVDLALSGYSGVLWALARGRLSAHAPGGLDVLGAVHIPFEPRTLSVSGGRALVAVGTDGLLLIDVSRPDDPRVLQQLTGVPFIFDAVLRGDVAFLAAGRGGLLELDLRDPGAPRITRALRNIGLVMDVGITQEGALYAVSQDTRRLYLLNLERRVSH